MIHWPWAVTAFCLGFLIGANLQERFWCFVLREKSKTGFRLAAGGHLYEVHEYQPKSDHPEDP